MQAALRLLILSALFSVGTASAEILDQLSFGDAVSESTHALTESHTEVLKGTLEESARRMLPVEKSWKSGSLRFRIKVDPEKQNYFTVRLSGDDVNPNQMILRVDGKQIGYRHLGDVEILDLGTLAPAFAGRFTYRTSPLPLALTKGKESINCEIFATGPIWPYASAFERMQKPMKEASRGLYKVYTHTGGLFSPPAEEKQGAFPANPPVRVSPGPEVMEGVKKEVNDLIDRILRHPELAADQMETHFLARAYLTPWTHAANNPKALDKIIFSLDFLYQGYVRNPLSAQSERSAYNPDWYGLGPAGEVISLLKPELSPRLDQQFDDGRGVKVTHREAWTRMLVACRDWHRENRRQYTNQSMINDLYGIYLANRGVAVLTPSAALPEEKAKRYLREAIGLDPWLGSEKDGKPLKPMRESFHQLTAKGLTRELGYVGSYGEVTDWICKIYHATRPARDQPGDAAIRAQLIKVAKARAPFRYPLVDAGGNQAMVQETIVGWRDTYYPGRVAYAQSPSWDGSPLEAAALTQESTLVGGAQQMLEDNQFFIEMEQKVKRPGFRSTAGLLEVPAQYEAVKAMSGTGKRMPMSWEQPDFVFADEQNGVIALKNGKEILYVSLYWRARYAVNFLARVHYITPEVDRIATLFQETDFTPSGMDYTRPDWTSTQFMGGGPKDPDRTVSSLAGEVLAIARIPAAMEYEQGGENLYAGRGDFYQLRYGNYLIAMNMSEAKTFSLEVPGSSGNPHDLVTRKVLKPGSSIKVAPQQTVVIFDKN